ncbi:hypothetical protein [Helicobacter canadensis]|uniref:hypothetical protein n=1 Tax=Helicobacter canadensis TaxID=123841 RepID=UPI001E561A7D|nr:hypothetical protein [Helicobacter canadensis]
MKNLILKHYNNKKNDKIKLKLRKEIDAKYPLYNVFAKMHEVSMNWWEISTINYPGFNVWSSIYRKEDKNFYFIDKIDFKQIKNRENKKLIVVFGNSALRVEYLVGQSITDFLRKDYDLREYIVINAGVSGYTIYEQLLLFNALFYCLKPDVVLSFFGGTDLMLGFSACDKLLKDHKMIYYPNMWESGYKTKSGSVLPIYNELKGLVNGDVFGTINGKVALQDICEAIHVRLVQFMQIATLEKAKFYAFIQPLLPCKLKWSDKEVEMRLKEKKRLSQVDPYQNELIEKIPIFIDALKMELSSENFVYDLNEKIKEQKGTFFESNWIHCNAKGNKFCASEVLKILKTNGL